MLPLTVGFPTNFQGVLFSHNYQQCLYCGSDVRFVSEVSFIPMSRLFLFLPVISLTQQCNKPFLHWCTAPFLLVLSIITTCAVQVS